MNLLRKLHYLNLDTATGALVMSLFVSKMFTVPVNWYSVLSLFLSVLLIYSFDHYQDAGNGGQEHNSRRLAFYQNHQKRLKSFIFLVALLLFISLWYLPLEVIKGGLILAFIVAVYFFSLKVLPNSSIFFKELLVAITYSLGVFLPSYSLGNLSLDGSLVGVFLAILLLAMMNLLIFSISDKDTDRITGQPNIAHKISPKSNLLIGVVLAIVNLGLIWTSWFGFAHISAKISLSLMTIVLLLILVWSQSNVRNHDLLRMLGEFVFILPLATLPYVF